MPIGTITLGATATQLTKGPQRAMQLRFWQGSSASYVADSSTVSSSTGIPVINATGSVQPLVIGPFTSGAINLSNWYGSGTTGDVIHYQYDPEE